MSLLEWANTWRPVVCQNVYDNVLQIRLKQQKLLQFQFSCLKQQHLPDAGVCCFFSRFWTNFHILILLSQVRFMQRSTLENLQGKYLLFQNSNVSEGFIVSNCYYCTPCKHLSYYYVCTEFLSLNAVTLSHNKSKLQKLRFVVMLRLWHLQSIRAQDYLL